MGNSSWSDDHYNHRAAVRSASNTPVFTHDADVRSGRASGVHEGLNPKGVTRESRDSKDHPNSNAIIVAFDITGSMGLVPRTLQTKLAQLMALLLKKAYIEDPQILFGAIGDYNSDRAPLQVGQFESGLEMEDDLSKIWLEGGGGGQRSESYQNIFYFASRHTSIDCFEKRNKKGYLFIIGDEMTYMNTSPQEILNIFGDNIEENLNTKKLIEEAQEKYHCFFISPAGSAYHNNNWLEEHWKGLIGPENFISLDDLEASCETIGLAIGYVEGTAHPDFAVKDLTDAGSSVDHATKASKALTVLASNAVTGQTNLPSHTQGSSVTRL